MKEIAKTQTIFYVGPVRSRWKAPMAEYEGPNFSIVRSSKAGLDSEESLLVVRGRVSYLRVLGSERRRQWELMTATAGEDDGSSVVCEDRPRLLEAAIRLSAEVKTTAREKKDWIGRDYVNICTIVRERPDEDLRDLLIQTVSRFFELFDGQGQVGTGGTPELAELYDAISSTDGRDDIYLTDGLWLSSDGSLHDRGR